MLSLILLERIAQLFLIMFLGWGIVRVGKLTSDDSRCLSVLLLYVISPCVIIDSFQLERTPETLQMMLGSFLSAIFCCAVAIFLGHLSGKLLHLDTVETASIIYSNASNLTIPLVSAIFGAEWIMFVTIYKVVQNALAWTHGRIMISGEKNVSLRKAFLNINIIAMFIGLPMFLFQIRLPSIVANAMSSIGNMVGPAAMLIVGMLMAGIDWKDLRSYRGIWKVVLLRMIVIPLTLTLLVKLSGVAALIPQGETLLLVSLLSAITPTANLIPQFCQLFGRDARYASLINVVTMLTCIITMPIMVAIYQL